MDNNYNYSNIPKNYIYSNNTLTPNQTSAITSMNQYIPNEQSFIENILRLNKGKKVTVYQSFCDSNEWKDTKFDGIIEQSGRDHIILSDPNTGKWYLLLMIYVNYIRFDENINITDKFYPST